jgi:hypothetical protein
MYVYFASYDVTMIYYTVRHGKHNVLTALFIEGFQKRNFIIIPLSKKRGFALHLSVGR